MISIEKIDFEKMDGLIPAVVQDANTRKVLMLGYMNREAVDLTIRDQKVTFFSRSRNALWQKGETTGNYLIPVSMHPDCDNDALLIKARPVGPTCHTGAYSCFGETGASHLGDVLDDLGKIIRHRKENMPEGSYTTKLFSGGIPAISQKVGEEAVEVAIAAISQSTARLKEEAADLLYHLLVLLEAKELTLEEIGGELRMRMR